MSKTKDIFLVVKKMYNYFTIWVLTISLLYYFGEFEDYYLDLLVLHLLISMISLYFVYIHPKRLIVDIGVRKFNLEGNTIISFSISGATYFFPIKSRPLTSPISSTS